MASDANSADVRGFKSLSLCISPCVCAELPPVSRLVTFAQDGVLWVEWSGPAVEGPPVEYVLQWVSLLDGEWDWQKEPRNATKAYVKGERLRERERERCWRLGQR